MSVLIKYRWLVALLFLISQGVFAQQEVQLGHEDNQVKKTRILILLDASRSMTNTWGRETKMTAARQVINNLVDTLKGVDEVEMALRVYGHQSTQTENNCRDSKLEISFRKNNAKFIKQRLAQIRPRGITPIAYSLSQAAKDFPNDPNSRNIIFMITDGVESCDRDPCYEIELLRQKRILLRAFVIGLGVDPNLQDKFDCLGDFYNAGSRDDLDIILSRTLKKILSRTVVRVDLLDSQGRAVETDQNMTFYAEPGDRMMYNYYHTMNDRGEPDTLYADPVLDYTLQVHTNPPVIKENVELVPNAFNIIQIPAAMGRLQLKVSGVGFGKNISCLVYKAGTHEVVQVQEFNTTSHYLIGKYDLEILTLPRIFMPGMKVSQAQTTSFEIPAPGYVTFVHAYSVIGGVFQMKDGELFEVYQLSLKPQNETIALQPGKYRIIYRSSGSRSMQSTIDRTFEVKSGGSGSIKL